MSFPSLTDIEAAAGTFLSSGKLGSVGAGAAAAKGAAELQTDILAAVSKAGAFLGPILGSSGIDAFQKGAAPTAQAAQLSFSQKYLGGFSPAMIGGVVVLIFLGAYLWITRRR